MHPVSNLLTTSFILDGVEVCSGGKTTNGASDDTVFCTPCNDGYSFCVSDKARKAVVTSPNGYSASMTTTDTHDMGYTCGNVGDAAKIKGLEVESCFRDEFGNCDAQPSCQLCDYRSDCKTTGG